MGRTDQEKERILKQKASVLKLAKKYNITYYEVGNNTPIATNTVKKIWEGTTIFPGANNLQIIEDYIINKYEKALVEEPPAEYSRKDDIREILLEINNGIKNLASRIEKSELKNELMFEILKTGEFELNLKPKNKELHL